MISRTRGYGCASLRVIALLGSGEGTFFKSLDDFRRSQELPNLSRGRCLPGIWVRWMTSHSPHPVRVMPRSPVGLSHPHTRQGKEHLQVSGSR